MADTKATTARDNLCDRTRRRRIVREAEIYYAPVAENSRYKSIAIVRLIVDIAAKIHGN